MKSNSQLKPHSKWMPATTVLIVTMMTGMLEPAAFAGNGDEAPEPVEQVAERAAPAPLPNRPVLVASAAFSLPQGQPRPATPLTRPTTPPAPQSKNKSKKWIWIVAAAGAGAATAIVLARSGSEETPTITVGSPIVGGPQ